MTDLEFKENFRKLVKAFTVTKPEDKAEIYFEKLSRLSASVFSRTCDYLTTNTDKFPTIMKILEVSRMFPDQETQRSFECKECASGGLIAKWRHSFRCTCLNGEKYSKNFPLVPITEQERRFWYGKLNKEWNDLYGKDLVEGHSFKGEPDHDIVRKMKETFGVM